MSKGEQCSVDLCCVVSDKCCEEGGEAEGGACSELSKYRMLLLRRWREHRAYAVYSEDLRYMYMARPVQDPRMKTSDWHPGGQVSDLDDGQKEVLRV